LVVMRRRMVEASWSSDRARLVAALLKVT